MKLLHVTFLKNKNLIKNNNNKIFKKESCMQDSELNFFNNYLFILLVIQTNNYPFWLPSLAYKQAVRWQLNRNK